MLFACVRPLPGKGRRKPASQPHLRCAIAMQSHAICSFFSQVRELFLSGGARFGEDRTSRLAAARVRAGSPRTKTRSPSCSTVSARGAVYTYGSVLFLVPALRYRPTAIRFSGGATSSWYNSPYECRHRSLGTVIMYIRELCG
eukprot:scaffold757_cov246-Pinguiococcus_pyrenoidosus.AAC.35